jgi:hypothetical protein
LSEQADHITRIGRVRGSLRRRGPVGSPVLSVAVIDVVSPGSITGAIYLAGSRRTRLRPFILAVYSTHLLFELALTLGARGGSPIGAPGSRPRSAWPAGITKANGVTLTSSAWLS